MSVYVVPLMEHVLQIDVVTASFFLGTVIPFVVGVLVKKYASSAVKQVTNTVLAVSAGVLATIVQAKGAVSVGQLASGIMAAVTGSHVLYAAASKVGLTQKVQNLAPRVGIGTEVVQPVESESSPNLITQRSPTLTSTAPGPQTQWAMHEADNSILLDEDAGMLAYIYPVKVTVDKKE